VRVAKSGPGPWGQFASDFFPGTEDLDPKSAFLLGRAKLEARPPDDSAEAILGFAIDYGFVPALRYKIENTPSRAPELLARAARVYGDPKSQFEYAVVLETAPATRKEALAFYKLAFFGGEIRAGVALGLRESPLSEGFKDYPKDAKDAVLVFEKVILKEENPIALHGLAQLLFNGRGARQDLKQADALLERARKQDATIPDLVTVNDAGWVTGAFVAAGVVLAVVVVVRLIRARNR
jgi:TPR repeat protein